MTIAPITVSADARGNIIVGSGAFPNPMEAAPSPPGSHLTTEQKAAIWPALSPTQRDGMAAVLEGGMNIVIGDEAMSGDGANDNQHCIAIGHRALENSETNSGHNYGATAIGFRAMHRARGSRYTTAVGIDCLTDPVICSSTTAVGAHIGTTCEEIDGCTVIGTSSLYAPGPKRSVIAIGRQVGDGGDAHVSAPMTNSIFVGDRSGRRVSGEWNVGVGHGVMGAGVVTGAYNVGVGRNALAVLAGTSYGNTAIGDGANSSITSGNRTTAVGRVTNTANFSNATAVGDSATCTKANQVMLGGTGTVEVTTPGSIRTGKAMLLPKVSRLLVAAPPAGEVAIFAEEGGGGKLRILAKFSNSAVVQMLAQP